MAGRPPKIPPELFDDIFAMVAKGRTQGEVVNWLLTSHGISVAQSAIHNLLKRQRGARSEIARSALVEYAANKLPADLTHADSQYNRMSRLLDMAMVEAEADLTGFNVDKVVKLSRELREATEQRHKVLGLDQHESPQINTLFDLLGGEEVVVLESDEEATN